MKGNFENAIDELKLVFLKINNILAVYLYGSVARGDHSARHSDLDLLVFIKKEDRKTKEIILDKISEICIKHSVKPHVEFQGLK